MKLEVAEATPLEVYSLMGGLVAPRPIAWVTTVSQKGIVNLAPFSFFNMFSSDPPVVVFSPILKKDGTKKDTLRNVETNGEFVLNGAVAALVEAINDSSREWPHDESEITALGLETLPSVNVKPPRLKASPFAMECQVRQILTIGSANLVIGDVRTIHIDDNFLDDRGRPDPRKLVPVARLGADYWCRATDLFELKRPV